MDLQKKLTGAFIEKFKARIVAKLFKQREEVDFSDNYSLIS